MHKGYTINYFINLLQGTTNSTITDTGIAKVVSPRLGRRSQAVSALNTFLGGNLTAVTNGTNGFKTYGKTPRARLLKALRTRQTSGTLFV